MPPVRRDQLVVNQMYYIRNRHTFQGPWGAGMGLAPFTYFGGIRFYANQAPGATFDAYSDDWLFFPFAGGVPIPPPVVAPRPVAVLPYGGRLVVSDGAQNVVSMANIAEGDQLVNWNMNADPQGRRESNFGHYYTMNTYNQLNPKISPTTRGPIRNPRRHTASLRVINTAFPKGSANAGLFNRARSARKRKGKSRKNKRS
jgi:hypothetical protein